MSAADDIRSIADLQLDGIYEPDDHRISIMCPTDFELVAILAQLDDIHRAPSCGPHGHNNYLAGVISGHKVIIATMAANKISPIEAAITACHVRHSFPNISCNLMVGVSSAAPSNRHDIRLGDVVVGLRKDGGPSVIQYDTGIMRQDREFQHQGRLNEPAAFARAAVGATAAYSFGGISKLETDVEATLARNEKLQKDFQRPSSREDRLCRSRCEYAADDADCEDFDHPDDPVLRLPRDPENMIVVHQGTIGSGNALVRDAIHRDMLSAKFNIICLDTESAGVMNVLPSLAIRGIFNYADGCHHGRKWRNYAALAAATYARLLLQNIRVVE